MRWTVLMCATALAVAAAGQAAAQDSATASDTTATAAADAQAPSQPPPSGDSPITDYFAHWFDRVNAAQASQPHWITPVATVTPRLEEEFRYDFGFQQAGNGSELTSYGLGKGLELIPTISTEVLLNIPAYQDRSVKKPATGFADDNFLVIKQRFLSANEQDGNYILTGFLGVQAPTGIKAYTNDAWVITPTIAGGFGVGDFDVQATLGMSFPLQNLAAIGKSVAANVAVQYHLFQFFWPEVEFNDTYWIEGPRDGLNQLFVSPGIIFGRFPIAGRVKAIVGVGYQIALSPRQVLSPLTPMYQHQVILTTRLTF